MSTGTTVSFPKDVTTSGDRLMTALGGRERVTAAAGLRVVADGERNHPGWGFRPDAPEKVDDFSYALVEDSVASRYRIAIKSHTYLVPAPVPAQVEGVTSSMMLQTAHAGRLEMYRVTSDRSEDMMIVYLSGPKLVFESDLWNPTPTPPQRGPQRGRLACQLCDAITGLGLDVKTIVGEHSGTDGKTTVFSAPIEHLKEAAER